MNINLTCPGADNCLVDSASRLPGLGPGTDQSEFVRDFEYLVGPVRRFNFLLVPVRSEVSIFSRPIRLGPGPIGFWQWTRPWPWTPDSGITLPEQLAGKMEIHHKNFLGIKFKTNYLLQFLFINLDRMNNFV